MFRTMVFVAACFTIACSGQSPVSPSSAPSATEQHASGAKLSVLSMARRGDTVFLTVRNSGDSIRVGLAVFKRVQTTQPLALSNLALYSDANVLVGAGETKELAAAAVPCGPFRFMAYHTRSSAGEPALKGAPSKYDLASEHVLSEGQDEWNRWAECVAGF